MPDAQAASLDAFLASVEHRAFRMASVVTRDRDAALDLVQDAMFKLVRRYAQRPPEEWRPLFFRCLQNRIRDWQRRQWLRRRLFLQSDEIHRDDAHDDTRREAGDVADPAALDGAAEAQREQAMNVLKQALRELPARQRQAFELRVWEGLDVRDTALAMACAEGSVKTHLSRALTNLRSKLEGVWP
ncbi:RNA polymerase sigma-70 factor (ECF subfamily) [Panacagrimonas perspica]|uniref:RNA polymerase sigma-70 factor (ECF subfamily) n=1 Tax=Panacagrimonas perspica TaxID=381431 RepID=A0A4R7P9Y4_9GAMM|nr:RNA polymerase sigma factor [Panacagrimonas perspica]TDU30688.1 RNA polymerase sigma-70 factor (ECF subfamily) [Panacagrimonas perspica]THD01519.1 RNA polymerase sigma factor [Panacagrimonas perspica]